MNKIQTLFNGEILKYYVVILLIAFRFNPAMAYNTHSEGKVMEGLPEIAPLSANSDALVKVPTGCGKGFQTYVKQGLTKEEPPYFQGGDDQMVAFVRKNVVYPDSALKVGIAGSVYIQFIVNPDGHLSDFKVIKSINFLLDREALRVVKSFPNWIPGTTNDLPIKVRVSLPIKFWIR